MTLRAVVVMSIALTLSCHSSPPASADAGDCTDLKRSNNNCGRCGNVCAVGESCADGRCLPHECGTRTCSGETVCLEGACADRRCFEGEEERMRNPSRAVAVRRQLVGGAVAGDDLRRPRCRDRGWRGGAADSVEAKTNSGDAAEIPRFLEIASTSSPRQLFLELFHQPAFAEDLGEGKLEKFFGVNLSKARSKENLELRPNHVYLVKSFFKRWVLLRVSRLEPGESP